MRDRKKALDAARRREKQGDLDVAVSLYLEAAEAGEAARVRANQARYGEAGELLLNALGVQDLSLVAGLEGAPRKRAYLAAVYLSKGEQVDKAVQILVALGEKTRAADLLERSGDLIGAQQIRTTGAVRSRSTGGGQPAVLAPQASPEETSAIDTGRRLEHEGRVDLAVQVYVKHGEYREAGRVLGQQGKLHDAARAYEAGGHAYEAGICYLRAGDNGRGVDQLTKVRRDDPRYRTAAVQVVRTTVQAGRLEFVVEHFLTEFIRGGPAGQTEIEAFYALSGLYERLEMVENAKEALRMVLAAAGGAYRDAGERLQRLERSSKLPSDVYRQISREDASFHDQTKPAASSSSTGGRMRLADLPGLPPLRDPSLTGPQPPSLPPPAQPSAATPTNALQPPPVVPAQPFPHHGDGRTLAGGIVHPASLTPPPSQGPPGSADPAAGVPTVLESPPQVAGAAASTASELFAVGATIAGRYRLQEKIGQGGMAMVFRGFDVELDEEVALKVFLQQTLDPEVQAESLHRFKQELKLSRQLAHPNIIRLYDIGMERGHRYITMELLVGATLDDLLEGGPIDMAQGLSYLVQSCGGLQAAHDRGVIHRDIKPDNLFISEDDRVKVLDFGIAKDTAGSGQTMAGMIGGTPEYMAPEQISDFSTVCPATDMYSLGVVAYRMFTERLPFEHDELMKLLLMHLNNTPRPPRELNPGIPEDLEGLILRLLRKDPTERFASCRELASHLQQVRRRFRRE